MTEHKETAATTFSGITMNAQAQVRANFAVQHLLTTARFARQCHRIEQENAGSPIGPFFEDILSLVTAGVFSSVASMEANLNELLVDHPRFGSTLTERAFEEIWRDAERRPLSAAFNHIPSGSPVQKSNRIRPRVS